MHAIPPAISVAENAGSSERPGAGAEGCMPLMFVLPQDARLRSGALLLPPEGERRAAARRHPFVTRGIREAGADRHAGLGEGDPAGDALVGAERSGAELRADRPRY